MEGDAHSDTALPDIASGTMLGKFEVLRKIATGGMAEIYLARVRGQAGFEKLVVIKRILPTVASEQLIGMFLDEARLAATFQHPNIADVYEVGEALGAPFFAMEHVHGQDVRSIRIAESERKQGLPLRVSLAIVHATASALDYAHDRRDANNVNLNLVHRDVSPSNILVSYEGAIKLIDFGVARVTNQSHRTQAGTVRGKCPYMSPEQVRGLPLDRRSDLFSLGVVLYELTVGRRPFQGVSDYEIMRQIVHEDAAPPRGVIEGYPPQLEHIVLKLLARDVDRRYQTAEQLLHELEEFLEEHHLFVPLKKLSRYMRALFADRLVGWERALRGDISTLAEHVALGMEPEHHRRGEATPPTPLPVVMRVAQELEAAALDNDASLVRPYKPGDRSDPLAIIVGASSLDDSVAFRPSNDTVTTRTGESAVADLLERSVAVVPGGDTVTLRTGESIAIDPAAMVSGGDTVTSRTGDAAAAELLDGSLAMVASGDTITTRTGEPLALSDAQAPRPAARRQPGAFPATEDSVTLRTDKHQAGEPAGAQPRLRTGPSELLQGAVKVSTRAATAPLGQRGTPRPATATTSEREVPPTDAPEPNEADAHAAVMQALNAPSFVAAIDALGVPEPVRMAPVPAAPRFHPAPVFRPLPAPPPPPPKVASRRWLVIAAVAVVSVAIAIAVATALS